MTNKQFKMEQMKELARQNKQLNKDREKLMQEYEEYLHYCIEGIYSAACIVLYRSGNDDESIRNFIEQVSYEWEHHAEVKDTERNGMTMAEYCVELTGFDIREAGHYEEESEH